MKEQEANNTREVYILQLDRARIVTLSGIFFFLLSGIFLLGYKLAEPKTSNEMNRFENQSLEKEAETSLKLDSAETGLKLNQEVLPIEEEIISQKQKAKEPVLMREPSDEEGDLKESKSSGLRIVRERVETKEDPFLRSPSSTVKKEARKLATRKENATRPIVGYTVQVAAFKHEKDALRLKSDLKKKGISARVEKGIRYYFVRTGKASSRKGLSSLARKVKSKTGIQTMVVRMRQKG